MWTRKSPHPSRDPAGRATYVLLACLAISLFCAAYPLYVIRPFRHQGANELAVALLVMRFRPLVTVIAAMASVLVAVRHRRAWPVAGAALCVVLAFLVRVNVYELMFHPDVHPSFTAASATKLDGAEKVVAVRIGGASRAYPIRSMSYHHIVNDVLGGAAIAATY